MSRCECCDSIIEHEARYLVAHYEHAPKGMGMTRSQIIIELREALERLDEEREERAASRHADEWLDCSACWSDSSGTMTAGPILPARYPTDVEP
jgi:hypothetical protein